VSPGKAALQGAGRTILIAEDDAQIRGLARKIFERSGYAVLVAEDGLQAVELVKEHGSTIDALLLDMRMPNLGGLQALEQARALHPHMPAVLCSGLGEADVIKAAAQSAPTQFVQKPYRAKEVLGVLQDLHGPK